MTDEELWYEFNAAVKDDDTLKQWFYSYRALSHRKDYQHEANQSLTARLEYLLAQAEHRLTIMRTQAAQFCHVES